MLLTRFLDLVRYQQLAIVTTLELDFLQRLTQSSGGPLLSQFRRPGSDGSTALLLDPLELLERLAALVPRPRTHMLVYHGLLAPHAGWRAASGPRPPHDEARPAGPPSPRAAGRLPWATLLRRVFAVDVRICPRDAGPRRILGAVPQPHAGRRWLTALGLPPPPPGRLGPAA